MPCSEAVTQESCPCIGGFSDDKLLKMQWCTADSLGRQVHFHDRLRHGEPGPELFLIPAGRIEIGSGKREFGHRRCEEPRQLALVDRPFALGRFTVTADDWAQFQRATGWRFRSDLLTATGRHPVMNIRHAEAEAYCRWLSEETGACYRLPTEEEWEYACRAGSTTPFHFGESVTCREVHFNATLPYEEQKRKKRFFLPRCVPMARSLPVGSKASNIWGLHEMHGNVWEMTSTLWKPSHRFGERADHKAIVTKGGSWFDAAVFARSASRMRRLKDELDVNLGFRVLRELS
ncbi:MAG: formylglycine-generating enzyme family protein [Gammaproteobacteria bacterium]|jgi:formylglycine-generating enzyme required for sulfatase activity